jgi:hypothetical protein
MNDVAQSTGQRPLLHGMTLKLHELGIFKLGMLALGIAVGAYWHDFFGRGLAAILVVAAACLAYIAYVYFRK